MNTTNLARKYRPHSLDNLIGQDVLVRNLKNSFEINKFSQCYVMTGIRGTGKTSSARIIARSLACKNTTSYEPCGECSSCLAMNEENNLDVIEIDAASHTSVADAKELISGTMYPPVMSKRKIFIIDECHMLSTSAWNALLKTLEEPPAHVIFIFCTTESKKVPATIISRSTRFDLRRVDRAELIPHFKKIAEKEGVRIEDGAINVISSAADGSVRDGISILDQIICGSIEGELITQEYVRDVLGLNRRMQAFGVFGLALSGKTSEALEMWEKAYMSGSDPIQFLQDASSFIHACQLQKKIGKIPQSHDFSEIEMKCIEKGPQVATENNLKYAWERVLQALQNIGSVKNVKTQIDMTILSIEGGK